MLDTSKKAYMNKSSIVLLCALSSFLVCWGLSFAISYFSFPGSFLVVDDPSTYRDFLTKDFLHFVLLSNRPASGFMIWLAFCFCGSDLFLLRFFITAIYALMSLSLFWLLHVISGRSVLSFLFTVALVFSRLNWYAIICVQGIMESFSLMLVCLCLNFMVLFLRTRSYKHYLWSVCFFSFAVLGHERYIVLLIPVFLGAYLGHLRFWKKIAFSLIPISFSLLFYFYKQLFLGNDFLIVNGNNAITFSLPILVSHFFTVLKNSVGFDCSEIWYAGYDNLLLSDKRWVVLCWSRWGGLARSG